MQGEPDFPSPETALAAWLAEQGASAETFVRLAGDVSARRYLRGDRAGESVILALYPSALLPACRRFIRTSELLRGLGVRVPAIHAADLEQGWMLLEDLGPSTLYQQGELPWERLEGSFASATEIAGRISTLPREVVADLSPPLDESLLRRELEQTWEAFFLPGDWLAPDEQDGFRAALGELCRSLGEARPLPCHRDFMARNLVPLPAEGKHRLAVIDHQDLRLGPPFYDLASLLNDSLFPPPEVEARLLAPILTDGAERLAYHRVAAQRTLKAVGTFAAFARRGSPTHLPLIPPTLARALAHLARVPETEPWVPVLRSRGRVAFC